MQHSKQYCPERVDRLFDLCRGGFFFIFPPSRPQPPPIIGEAGCRTPRETDSDRRLITLAVSGSHRQARSGNGLPCWPFFKAGGLNAYFEHCRAEI